MKKAFLLLIIASFFASNLAKCQKVIENHWGKKGFDGAFSVAATNDGGYVISGLTKSQGDTVGDIIVIKLTSHGDTSWTLKYGGPKLEGGNGIMQTADGGIMVTGHTQDFGAKDCDAFMMKLDKNGNHQWFNVYGGDSDDISESVVELPEGDFVFAGITASYGNTGKYGNRHIYVVKTDKNGKSLWEKHYGGTGVEYAYSLAKTEDGGFFVSGFSTSWGKGEDDGWLLRLNENGDTLWTRLYKSGGGIRFFQIIPTYDKGFMLAGYNYQNHGDKSRGLLVKLDQSGKELWRIEYGGATEDIAFNGIAQLPNRNYMMSGISRKMDPTGNVYVMLVDSIGQKISDNFYGGSYSYANCIAIQGSYSYLTAGSTAKWGDPAGDIYYMEMDNSQSGISPTNNPTEKSIVFPDPAHAVANILLPTGIKYSSLKIQIFNLQGKPMYSDYQNSGNTIALHVDGYARGLYFYKLTMDNGNILDGKFVIE